MPAPVPHTLYDFLKDFQPALAAAIALLAAALAYISATSKVRLDKRIADRDFAHRRLGTYMRVRFEIALISSVAHGISESAVMIDGMLLAEAETSVTAMSEATLQWFRKTPAIDEAWQQLHLLPLPVARNFDQFRQHLLGFLLLTTASTYALLPEKNRGPELLSKAATELAELADVTLIDFDGLIDKVDKTLE